MDHPHIPTQLQQIAAGLGADDLVEHLTGLTAALQQAVSKFAGLRVTVIHSGHPVTLTVTVPGSWRGDHEVAGHPADLAVGGP